MNMQEEFEKEYPRPPTFYWCDHQDEYVSDARDEEQLEYDYNRQYRAFVAWEKLKSQSWFIDTMKRMADK
jgi:hypothetical protein